MSLDWESLKLPRVDSLLYQLGQVVVNVIRLGSLKLPRVDSIPFQLGQTAYRTYHVYNTVHV